MMKRKQKTTAQKTSKCQTVTGGPILCENNYSILG